MPNYNKIDINPDEWPKGYWDRTLRCSPCEINWPLEQNFLHCPVCSGKTHHEQEPPHMRWPEAVKILLEERFEVYYQELKKEKASELSSAFDEIVEAA